MRARDFAILPRRGHPTATRRCLGVFLLVTLLFATNATAQNIWQELHTPDGEVNVMLTSGNLLYIGGRFSHVGPLTGPGAMLSAVSGQAGSPCRVRAK